MAPHGALIAAVGEGLLNGGSLTGPVSDEEQPSRPIRRGFITYTELASNDPHATREWCRQVLGWKFDDPVSTPTGEHHMWRLDDANRGGIRSNNPPERPGSIPYVEFPDIREAQAAATRAGAAIMLPPQRLPDGARTMIVQAPGGVPIGFWAPK